MCTFAEQYALPRRPALCWHLPLAPLLTAPSCRPRAQRLRLLHVAGAALVGSVPGCLFEATAPLLALNASANGLNGTLPGLVAGRLQTLRLAGVSGLQPRLGAALPMVLAPPAPCLRPGPCVHLRLTGRMRLCRAPPLSFTPTPPRQNNISGPLPEALAGSGTLRLLDLSGNALAGSLPQQWGGSLELLSLAGNQLTGACERAGVVGRGRCAALRCCCPPRWPRGHLCQGHAQWRAWPPLAPQPEAACCRPVHAGAVPPTLTEHSALEELNLAGNRLAAWLGGGADKAAAAPLTHLSLAGNNFSVRCAVVADGIGRALAERGAGQARAPASAGPCLCARWSALPPPR